MNREQARGAVQHAALISAFADGAKIEYKDSAGKWFDCVEPAFKPGREYRIKPEPKTLFAVESILNQSVWAAFHDEEAAERSLAARAAPSQWRIVEYREVTK